MTSPTTSTPSSTMPPPPRPTTSPVPVFAPKPLRLPQSYLPQRSVLLPQRTPSPRTSRSRSSSTAEPAGERLYSPGPPSNESSVLDDFLKLVKCTTPPPTRKEGVAPAEKLVIPASPVSRSLTRNPMIHNSQFGLVQEVQEES